MPKVQDLYSRFGGSFYFNTCQIRLFFSDPDARRNGNALKITTRIGECQ